MNNLTDRIKLATQHRNSDFFCDSRVADNINNMNNMNEISTIKTKLTIDNCDLESALEDISPSASLTSPSEAAIEGPLMASEDCSERRSATRDDELQIDPTLPVKMIKVDLIDNEKLAVTVNITSDKNETKVLKAHMNTHKKHWKRTNEGNLKDRLPEHCRLVDECIAQHEQDSFWDTVRVSKFVEYHGSVSKNKTFRNSLPGVTGVLCYNRRARVAVLHLFLFNYQATIRLDKDLTPKQKETGYLASGMLIKRQYTTYKEVDLRSWLGM